ncbi:MAG: hypothetical protein ACM3PY_17510, partial [Omnitrophica WOR_2 bacterium]
MMFLWLVNYVQVPWFVILSPLKFALILTGVVCLISWLIVRNMHKAAVLACLFLVLFFFYGQLIKLIEGWKILNSIGNYHIVILIAAAALWIAGSVSILRNPSDLSHLTGNLNLVFGLLLMIPLVQLGYHIFILDSPHQISSLPSVAQAAHPVPGSSQESSTPDVYYFLLDAYDREDMLQSDIHFDNHDFIVQLEQLGFVVPNCTQSNYNTTVSSMAGTLNMNYLDHFGISYSDLAKMDKNRYTEAVQPLDFNNQVMAKFKQMGYQIITLKEGWPFIDYPKSDIVYNYQTDARTFYGAQNYSFQYLYLRNSLLQPLIESVEESPDSLKSLPPAFTKLANPIFDQNNQYNYSVAQQNLYQLKKLESIAQVPGKKFLYAHLMITHPPFTLTRTGALRSVVQQTNEAYADSVVYANQRMLAIIKNILSQSKNPPVIILQGDHAYGWEGKGKDAFKILNAYYLPQNGNAKVYASITPVNSFRL